VSFLFDCVAIPASVVQMVGGSTIHPPPFLGSRAPCSFLFSVVARTASSSCSRSSYSPDRFLCCMSRPLCTSLRRFRYAFLVWPPTLFITVEASGPPLFSVSPARQCPLVLVALSSHLSFFVAVFVPFSLQVYFFSETLCPVHAPLPSRTSAFFFFEQR